MRRRRRNPMPSTGALLVNPRRRNKTTRRKRKATTTKRRRANPSAKRRAAAKKGAATRRRNANKRSLAAKRAAATRRRNTRRRNTRRRNPRGPRRAPRIRRRPATRRIRRARKAIRARRRNPSMSTITGPIQKMVKKIPLVGKFLSTVVGFAGPAALGAVSVYPTLQALKYGGDYIPERLQPFSFTIAGTLLAAVVGAVPFGPPAFRKNLATAMAAGGGAVDFYRWQQGQSTVAEMEVAETAGLGYAGYGGGMATGVVPYGALQTAQGQSLGALEVASDYAGAAMGDAHFSGGDFSGDEIACALAGPRHWRKRFGLPAKRIFRRGGGLRNRVQSGMASQHGHRWGWLIKLIGPDGMRRIASLPIRQRKHAIQSLRQQALASLPAIVADHATRDPQVSSDEAAGMGALITMAGW